MPFLQTTTGIVLGLVIGLVFAALAYFFYYFAVVLLGATAGYDLGSGFIGAIGLNNLGSCAVIVGVVLAVIFVLLDPDPQPAQTTHHGVHCTWWCRSNDSGSLDPVGTGQSGLSAIR